MKTNRVLATQKTGFSMMRLGGVLAILMIACAVGLAQTPSPILADGAKWQKVFDGGLAWAEGVVAAKDGTIYLSDVTRTFVIKQNNPGGTIFHYVPATGATTKLMEPSGMSNGLHVDRKGDLIIAQDADTGGRAILRRNLKTGATVVLANNYEGKKFNGPNDLTSDAQGRIYFTDARYAGNEAIEMPNAVYRIDPDGKVSRIASDSMRPNGIEVSPDGKRLYVLAFNLAGPGLPPVNPLGPTDKFGMKNGGVVVYDLDKSGNISNGRVFFQNEEAIGPDGGTMDAEGNLYLALHNGNRTAPKTEILVLSPAGKVLAHLPAPGPGLLTNLCFGRGAESKTLYAAMGAPFGLYRIQTLKKGFYWK